MNAKSSFLIHCSRAAVQSPAARRCFSTHLPVLQQAAEKAKTKPPTVKNYIHGEFVESQTDKWIELRNPVSFHL